MTREQLDAIRASVTTVRGVRMARAEDVRALLAHIDALEESSAALRDFVKSFSEAGRGAFVLAFWQDAARRTLQEHAAGAAVLAELEQARRERDDIRARFAALQRETDMAIEAAHDADARAQVAREQGKREGVLEALAQVRSVPPVGMAEDVLHDAAERIRALAAQPKADTEDKS